MSTTLLAQVTFYNNAVVTVMSGAIVQVNGNVELNGNNTGSSFENNGDVTVSNSTNAGDFFINAAGNSAIALGSGTIHVEGDWINDGSFIAQASTVELFGVNQLITGDSVTIFNNLTLLTGGVKRQTIDALVNTTLALNDSELATDNFTMYVLNSAVTAVTTNAVDPTDNGFVSSLLTGSLWWQTSLSGSYLFPLGSSLNTNRYRPLQLQLTAAGANAFGARLANNLATNDGYDVAQFADSICALDIFYYHEIHRTAGADAVNLTMFYETADGVFDAIGMWASPLSAVWNKAGSATASTSGLFFQTLTVFNWNDFSEFPFILGQKSPDGPIISGLPEACEFQISSFSLTPNNPNSTNFDWSVSASDASLDGPLQGTTNMDITWGSTGGEVTAIETHPNGCVSLPSAPISVTLYQGPTAAFTSAVNDPQLDVVDFTDSSTSAFGWEWDFGDEEISSSQNPSHEYDEVGTYTVMLVAEDENGCVDTIYSEVTVEEGVIFPIVFSPNNDGINDVFMGGSAGLKEYNLTIYNRWGELIFESVGTKAEWTGYTFGGELCTPGTYFYVLTASGVSGEDYNKNGHVTLLR
ncbi:MAG: gliding motility-associated C-terminal domain-containing protein [Flavobacteriales bacterium]|nr:gliding motility-associated C-terminal domain-containing protein [Flavobacteriales bacterium]